MSNAGLADAASALDAIAAGVEPNRAELMSGALALNYCIDSGVMNAKLQAAALGLSVQASAPYDRRAYMSEAGRRYAGTLAEEVRKLMSTQ
jgi:hypothetical protein